jgi:hypothetical protein
MGFVRVTVAGAAPDFHRTSSLWSKLHLTVFTVRGLAENDNRGTGPGENETGVMAYECDGEPEKTGYTAHCSVVEKPRSFFNNRTGFPPLDNSSRAGTIRLFAMNRLAPFVIG